MKKKTNRKNEKRVGVLDFETDPFQHARIPRPFVCGIYFGESDKTVIWGDGCEYHVAEYLKELPPCTLYAHNGGKFDFHFLLKYANTDKKISVVNGRVAYFYIGDVKLIDSFLLIPFALAKYKKTEIDYKKFERNRREKYKDEIISYLLDDCRDLHELLAGFKKITGDVLTIGAAAMQAIKESGIKIEKLHASHDEKFRPYYFGGRCQAFETGIKKGKFKFYDINSAYPFAMLNDHPHGDRYCERTGFPSFEDGGAWFAHIKAVSFGALPVREKDGLSFPDDGKVKEFFATGHEIIAGVEAGLLHVKKILSVHAPERKINFSVFVNTTMKKRNDAKKNRDKIGDLAYKTLANSGYGKFAQDPEKFRDYKFFERGEAPDGFELEQDFGELSLWSKPAPDPAGYFDVATAASITGQVRATLLRAIAASARPLYCDTDSLLCEAADVDTGPNLGQWKLEGEPTFAAIAGKKLYAVRGRDFEKIASKGAKLTFDEIISISRGGCKTWKNSAPTFSLKKQPFFVKRKIVAKRVKNLLNCEYRTGGTGKQENGKNEN